jgi:predicted PurR-regulated permease PerM
VTEPPSTAIEFSTLERTLFRYVAIFGALMALAGLLSLLVWLLARLVSFFFALLLPLSVAGVLSLILYPVVRRLQRITGLSRTRAVTALFAAVTAVVVIAAALVLPTAIQQVQEFIRTAPDLAQNASESFSRAFPTTTARVASMLDDVELHAILPNLEGLGSQLMNYAAVIVGLAFVPLYLFFALISGDRLNEGANEALSVLRPQTQSELMFLGHLFVGYVTAFFQGQVVIALIMGVLLATGFSLIGLQAAILLGLILGFLNIVPYLGTIVGLTLALPVAYLQPDGGGLTLVAMVLAVFVVVQIIESWLLTPKIMADRSGLHPAIVVISIFFWGIALGGIIGMIMAVPLSAFVASLWRHFRSKWSSTLVAMDNIGVIEEHPEIFRGDAAETHPMDKESNRRRPRPTP